MPNILIHNASEEMTPLVNPFGYTPKALMRLERAGEGR